MPIPSKFALQVLAGTVLATSTCAPIAFAQQTDKTSTQAALTAPDAATILKTLRAGHPRLLATADDFAALKARTQNEAWAKSWKSRLLADADKILPQAPSKYEIPDGLRLLATSRRVLNRTYALAMAFKLTGDAKYSARLWDELNAAANFPDWNPRHFLDTAEMTHAFAIGYDWLYDAWTPEQKTTLREAMLKNGLRVALAAYRGENKFGWWAKVHHNWNQVCNGGIGVGALALADEEPALCGELLQNAVANLPLAMREFAPDGAWSEGPGYWDYSTKYNVAILAGLDSALGTDFGLSGIEGFGQTGDFPLYTASPNGLVFNYADSGDKAPRPPQLFWLADRFKRPDWAQFAQPDKSAEAWAGLWYRPSDASAKMALPPLAKEFRGADVMTMRSAWNDPNATFVGFKAGDNAANHSHLDLGTWVLDALGERFIFNFGGDDYNLPDYFGKLRWTYYRLRTEGQNTLVFNPSEAPGQDLKARAHFTKFQADKPPFAIADLSPAYPQNGVSVQRGLKLNGTQLLLQDEWQNHNKAALDVWWFAHTSAQVELPDAQTALLTLNKKQLRAHIVAPASAKWEIMDAKPLPSSPQPPKQNENKGARKLAIHLPVSLGERLVVTFTPVAPNAPDENVAVKRLEEW